MPAVTMEITLGGVILILGQALTFVAFVWKRSGVESEQRAQISNNTSRITALESDVENGFERVETETQAKVAALQGAVNLMRDMHHELREHLATNYMKREEILLMERRITDSQTALRADITKIDAKLDTKFDALQKVVLDAIAQLRNR